MNTQAFWVLSLSFAAAALGSSHGGWDFCTVEAPCAEGEGDCDTINHCKDSLVCGTDNCRDFPGNENMASGKDCCRQPANFDWVYCTEDSPCGFGEGDCDNYEECSGSLECGTDNCRDFDPSGTVNPAKDCCRASVLFDWNHCSAENLCMAGEGDCDSDADCSGNLVCGTDNCQLFDPDVNSSKDCCMEDPTSSDDSGNFGGSANLGCIIDGVCVCPECMMNPAP